MHKKVLGFPACAVCLSGIQTLKLSPIEKNKKTAGSNLPFIVSVFIGIDRQSVCIKSLKLKPPVRHCNFSKSSRPYIILSAEYFILPTQGVSNTPTIFNDQVSCIIHDFFISAGHSPLFESH
jgi:hypothetical protein